MYFLSLQRTKFVSACITSKIRNSNRVGCSTNFFKGSW